LQARLRFCGVSRRQKARYATALRPAAAVELNMVPMMAVASRSVLVVAHRFSLGFGGVPESILLLAGHLAKVGVVVDVICKDGVLKDVGKLDALPASGRRPGLRELLEIDVRAYRSVFIAGSWNPVALLFGIRARLNGVRLIYSPKGNLAFAEFKRPRDIKKLPYLLTLELLLLMLSQRIVFSSKLERDHFVLRPLFTRFAAIIPEPFRGPAVLDFPASRGDSMLRFGFLAEIAPRKGLKELVRAFANWQQQGASSAVLHIAGEPRPGSERYYGQIRDIARKAADPSRIIWRGPLRGVERDGFFDSIDILICPTKFESFGLTPLEALWRGKPVIVTANMGVLEFVSDQYSIITLKDGSEPELLRGMREAEAKRHALAAAARGWRLKPQPGLTGVDIISRFIVELELSDITTRLNGAFFRK
jgi:glycosyltransferase involved in cell wall biosynthesis